jgi:predicted esterase
MPTFKGYGPYRRWTKPGINSMPNKTCALIKDIIKEQVFVSVLGFSQGAKLTARLLLE